MRKASLKEYFFSFISKYKVYIAGIILCALLKGIFDISIDYKIKEIIDNVADNKGDRLHSLILLFIAYKLIAHLLHFFLKILNIIYKPRIIEENILEIYQKTTDHSLHWFDSHLSGEISSKISDFQRAISILLTHIFKVFSALANILVTLFFVSKINIEIASLLFAFTIIHTPVTYFLMKKQMKLQREYVRIKQQALGLINDSIMNIFGIKTIGNVHTEFQQKLAPAISRWKMWEKKTRKFDTYIVDNIDTIMVLIMSAVQIYMLAYLLKSGKITPGSFAFMSMMTLKIHHQLDGLLEDLMFNINPSLAQMKSSYEFVASHIDVIDKEDAIVMKEAEGNIEYKGVQFSYGDKHSDVLSDFNLSIKKGERIGIAGPSGAGKSTMIKCLLRYFDIKSGAITIDGVDIRDMTQESLRGLISLIPQDITMFHRSVADNLRLAKHNASDEEIASACRQAMIHDDIMDMPNGYETIVGERGIKLSGGQRQRIAIARAILKNSPILILDEATSSLDTKTEKIIQESISRLLNNSKATVISVAHRLSTLKDMDRIIVIKQGKIAESGSHHSLVRQKGGIYRGLWHMQSTSK